MEKSPTPSDNGPMATEDTLIADRRNDKLKHDEVSSSLEKSTSTAWTREKVFAIVTFCGANFCTGAYYSILGPFFPQEAAEKGMNSTLTGLVFSCFEMVIIIMSPIYGTYMTRIGAKFMYVAGLFVAGITSCLFGVLEYCPPGTIYIVMCFLVRSVEGLGTGAFVTASYAIIANTFPDKVASMLGNLELFTGLGLMIGPPLGGVLYQFGGFKLPFLVMGGFLLVIAILSIFILPSQDGMQSHGRRSIFALLKIPVVLIMVIIVSAGTSCIGFIDVGLSIWLNENFGFTPIIVGLMFLIGPGMYAIMSPIWGCFADKFPQCSTSFIMIGYMIAGVGFIFMGPAPFIPLPSDMLWLLILTLICFGLGVGSLVASFQVITNAAIEDGMPENLDTYGLVSGLFTVCFSIGTCVGPLLGGYLLDVLNFQWAAFTFGCIVLFCTLLIFIYLVINCPCRKQRRKHSISYTPVTNEDSPLVSGSIDSDQHNNRNFMSYGAVNEDLRNTGDQQ